jgi:mannose-6-phosphate isomerase-like protein (cupin superfamily)
MKIFDLYKMRSFPYKERDKNVFYHSKEFKTRIINLSAGEKIPECEMASYVIFLVLQGEAIITVDSKDSVIDAGKCIISDPAVFSLKTKNGVKIIGIQINKID